ncbi:MAG: VWA domain-containing protein [Dehalococcoidia bacterium]|nr:VWA domain-containing protein [Dehalococcoidia bacterium]
MSLDIFRYSRWDGTQDIFGPDAEDLLNAMSDSLMDNGNVEMALRDLMRHGMDDSLGNRMMGLQEIMESLRSRRREELDKYNLDSLMDEITEKLNQIVDTETKGINKRVEEARKQYEETVGSSEKAEDDTDNLKQLLDILSKRADNNREAIQNLPESTAGAIRELQDYEFMDSDAHKQFQDLMDMMRGRMMDNIVQDMKNQMSNMGPQDMQALGDMMDQLNDMLWDAGENSQAKFDKFMEQYGNIFGENKPENLDQLIDMLRDRMSQVQSLMNSMSPGMRNELAEIMNSAMPADLQESLEEFSSLMEQMFPGNEFRNRYPFSGQEPITYDRAMDLMNELQNMDDLERQIQNVGRRGGSIQDLDLSRIEEFLGEDVRANTEQLQQISRMLEEMGYLSNDGDLLKLTPKALRKIGLKALKDVFSKLKLNLMGQHPVYLRGRGGEYSGETKPYEFGDPFDIHLERTLSNAVMRSGGGVPVKMAPEDFEIHRTEHMARASTVLLLDQSRSMGYYGNFVAAKKVAMALASLIRIQYPRDRFYIVGFSDYAIQIEQDELTTTSWNDWVSGTNMHHAFMLSRNLLAKDKSGTKQILMITDGEPTCHIQDGRSAFRYPPSYKTIQETLKEVKRCTKDGITINTFMLEKNEYLVNFVDNMTRINKGRAFYSSPDKLGEYILVDYLTSRRSKVN